MSNLCVFGRERKVRYCFGRKRQRFSPGNFPKTTPNSLFHRTQDGRTVASHCSGLSTGSQRSSMQESQFRSTETLEIRSGSQNTDDSCGGNVINPSKVPRSLRKSRTEHRAATQGPDLRTGQTADERLANERCIPTLALATISFRSSVLTAAVVAADTDSPDYKDPTAAGSSTYGTWFVGSLRPAS